MKIQLLEGAQSYSARGKEIMLCTKSISSAKTAFFAAINAEAAKPNASELVKTFANAAKVIDCKKDTFDRYCKYMDRRYNGKVPQKGYSGYYIWQFFEKEFNLVLSQGREAAGYFEVTKYLRREKLEKQNNKENA